MAGHWLKGVARGGWTLTTLTGTGPACTFMNMCVFDNLIASCAPDFLLLVQGLQSDARFADMYVRGYWRTKAYSPSRLAYVRLAVHTLICLF
jgi:hypothetical protein